MSKLLVALLGATVLLSTPALAQRPTQLEFVAVNQTAATEAAAGRPRASEVVRGGDVVRYRMRFTNTTGDSITNVVMTNPIPEGMTYLEGRVADPAMRARVEYSLDGGRSYVATLPAPASDSVPAPRPTHVRWTVTSWVKAGQTFVAHYDTRFGAPARPAAPARARVGIQ